MKCIALDKKKNVVNQIYGVNPDYVGNIGDFTPEAFYFLFFENDKRINGTLRCTEDFIIQKGSENISRKRVLIPRMFFWEKYLDTNKYYPKTNLREIYLNQRHIFDGRSEETVPYPMPEEEIRIEEDREFVLEEILIPDSVYDINSVRLK